MIRQPEIEKLKKLLNNTVSSVIGISRGFLEDVVQEHEEPSRSELYNQGLNDAWELLRKLSGLKSDEFIKIYDTCILYEVIYKNTPQEAIAKLKSYEEAHNIRLGDIVKNGDMETEFVVIATSEEVISGQPILRPIGKTLIKGVMFGSDKDLKKTGKHIDIQSILEQIGE